MNTHQKFLEFNGKNIVFLSVNGTYWIALKPICEALGVNVRRSIDNVKKDAILGPECTVQYTQVSKNGKSQLRNVTCIPEKYIYGWIFSLRSESEALTEYKRTCYELLYNHFHGTITKRKDLLIERMDVDNQIHILKSELKEKDEHYKLLKELESKRKLLSTQLNASDKEIVTEREIQFPEN